MRIVVGLGGNAVMRRGEPLTAARPLANIQRAAAQIARIAEDHEITASTPWRRHVLGAQTDGMIGYLLEQELGNLLQARTVATLLTRVEVDLADPAFRALTKPIGPLYATRAWSAAPPPGS